MSYFDRKQYDKVVCVDGFTVSIQASETSYCVPRTNTADRYESVELGYPTASDELIMDYAEDAARPSDTVYGYVPVSIVNLLIAKHGGTVSGTAPPGVILLPVK